MDVKRNGSQPSGKGYPTSEVASSHDPVQYAQVGHRGILLSRGAERAS